MAQTVNECLTVATDSVTVINDINTNGQRSKYVGYDSSLPSHIQEQTELIAQEEVNNYVNCNVNHLKTILAYEPGLEDGASNIPDIIGYTGDKSSYTSAITTGEAYIAANS